MAKNEKLVKADTLEPGQIIYEPKRIQSVTKDKDPGGALRIIVKFEDGSERILAPDDGLEVAV